MLSDIYRAGAPGIAGNQKKFEHSGNQNAPSGGVAGGGEKRGDAQRHHQRHIQQDRRGGGGGETLQRIEDAAIERDQGNQQQIGECDAGKFDGERIAHRVIDEARRQKVDDGGREQQRPAEQQDLAGQQQRQDTVGKQPGPLRPVLLADAGIGRHEGGVERALGENRAEMVGQAQRHEKGVGHRSRAQDRRQNDVADKAGHPRKQGKTADRENALNHQS